MANSNRKPYLTSLVLDQDFLDESHDNLVNQLELIVIIETPTGFIRGSDRNKYVGENFYRALLTFPVIRRTVGEFLAPTIELSSLSLNLNNVDGSLNNILPAGDNFDGWINKTVEVQLGLRDVAATYTTIFDGRITEEGGLKRTINSVEINARDQFDKLSVSFPTAVLKKPAPFAYLEDDLANTIIPIIYGDWTTNVEPNLASIPAYPLNGANPLVNGDTDHSENLDLIISDNDNVSFDTSEVYLRRGESAWRFAAADITNVTANRRFEIIQDSLNMTAVTPDTVDEPYEYSTGDEILVKVQGKDLGAYDDNPVWIARDILITYAGMTAGEFDANWATFRDKASPAESNIAGTKCRVWLQEPQEALQYALSLLEQVRLEAFIDRNLKLKIASLHFDDFVAAPTHKIRNFDIEEGSFQPQIDERNNFNRTRGLYNFLPNRSENLNQTAFYRNDAAITQAGKEISKGLVFPNLYEAATVENQVKETLKITSGYIEHLVFNATWRSLLLDIGDFVSIDVKIQGTQFDEVPAMIREIGYDPAGIKIPMKVWSFQMLPFTGYTPGYNGTVGGESASITEET